MERGDLYVGDVGQDASGEVYVLGNETGVPFGAGDMLDIPTGVVLRIAKAVPENFRTHLSGREHAPNPVNTRAQEQAIFQLSRDGTELTFKVVVAKIENVIGAHIHLAPAGAIGPIVLSMVPDTTRFLDTGPFIPDPGVTLNRIRSKFKFTGLVIHSQHIFHRYIRHDAVVRAANVAAVFAQHPDALTDFPADIVGGSKGQGGLGGDSSEKGDMGTVFTL